MIYSREWLENCADEINGQFFPERLSSPSSLDVYDLVDAIGCDVEWKYISPDDSILGMTFFGDGYWYIWPTGNFKKDDRCKAEVFTKGTVVINSDFSFISKILHLMPSKLLIYGKHDRIAEQQLTTMGIDFRVYPDLHRLCKGVI